MAEITSIQSTLSGGIKKLLAVLHHSDDDYVGDLRDAACKALNAGGKLHVGLKQIQLFNGADRLDDDSISLNEALCGAVPKYSVTGPEVYKSNIKTPMEPRKAMHVKATVEFPDPTGVNINMMPIVINDPESIPEEYRQYAPLVAACFPPNQAPSRIGFLTINEGQVQESSTQRRGGVHIECPGYLTGGVRSHGEYRRVHDSFGNDVGDKFEGGICMASTVSNSTAFWGVTIEEAGEVVGPLGDLEHIRSLLPEDKKNVLAAGQLVWFTDATPHEALPMENTETRQFFRLVIGDLSQWNEQHNTKNPLGVCPDPKVTEVVNYNKFDLSPSKRRKLEMKPKKPEHITVKLEGLSGDFFGAGLIGESCQGERRYHHCALIKAGGMVADWNRRNPEKSVQVWDQAVAINEIALSGSRYIRSNAEHLKGLGAETVTFRRGLPLAPAPGESPETALPWAGLLAWFDAKDAKKGRSRFDDRSPRLLGHSNFLMSWSCKAGTGHVLRRSDMHMNTTVDSDGLVAINYTDYKQGNGYIDTETTIQGIKTAFWVLYREEDHTRYVSNHQRGRFLGEPWQTWDVHTNNEVWPAKKLRAYCSQVESESSAGWAFRNLGWPYCRLPDGSSKHTGVHIAEILFYNRILSDSEVDSVLKYLSDKWNA